MAVDSSPGAVRKKSRTILLFLSAYLLISTIVTGTIVKTNELDSRNRNIHSVVRYQDMVDANSLDDPLSGASSCTPGREGRRTFVCDASALLAPRSARRIDAEIQDVYTAQGKYKRALCDGREMSYGYLIEVAVVRRMDTGRNYANSANSASEFASTLYRNWKVGDMEATCGNGVLILISLEDRKYFFATGSNVQRIMKGHSVNKVERALVKYLKRNNVYMAVLNAVMVLGKELAKNTQNINGAYYDYGAPPAYNNGSKGNQGGGLWGFIVLVIALLFGASLCIAAYNSLVVKKKEAVRRIEGVVASADKEETPLVGAQQDS